MVPLPVLVGGANFCTMPNVVNVAIGQLRPRKGDVHGNLARIAEVISHVATLEPEVQVLHLAETVLSGYFVEGGVRELAFEADTLAQLLNDNFRAAAAPDRRLDVVLGFYEIWDNNLHNSAMCVTLGGDVAEIRHIHRKLFLPTYGLFDEERFVERGHEIRAFDTSWGRAAILVCEDAWHSLSGTIAALDGAQFIFLCAAAPSRGVWPRKDDTPGPNTLNRWERLARDIAEEHGIFVSLSHLVGSEGGKVFAGGSIFVGPRGDIMVRAPIFDEAIITAPAEMDDITRARADMPLLSDLRTVLPYMLDNMDKVLSGDWDDDDERANRSNGKRERKVERSSVKKSTSASGSPTHDPRLTTPDSPLPTHHSRLPTVVRANGSGLHTLPLDIDPEIARQMLVTFIGEEYTRRGYTRAVIGLSGGVDSAVAAYLAAEALGADNVTAVCMPYRTSHSDSLAHAQLVIKQLGIQSRVIDISAAVDGYLANETDANPTRRGNVMSRNRMIVLFDLAAKLAALPLGTGNKTERLLGYFTWHADDSPPINPIGDLYKTQVWQLAKHLQVPEVIVGKPATADLVHGQTDEGDLGVSYASADRILNALLAGYSAQELVARDFPQADVEKVAKRLSSTHWKRRLPTVAMLSPSAIGESYLRPVDY